MSAELHKRLADTATKLIKKHGRPIHIVRDVDDDPNSFDPVAEAPVEILVTGVQDTVSLFDQDGTTIESGDVFYLFDSAVPVTTSHRIKDDDGTERPVIALTHERPGTVSILYEVQTRL